MVRSRRCIAAGLARGALAAAVFGVCASGAALAQIPAQSAAPAGADIVARALSRQLQQIWGQPVIVENRPGAGGQIGSQAVAGAPADGYTLLVQSASHAANPAIYKKLPYEPTRDFVDVAMLATTPYVMLGAAGRTLFCMAPLPTIGGMRKAGKIAPLAVTSSQRVASLPEVPAAVLARLSADGGPT